MIFQINKQVFINIKFEGIYKHEKERLKTAHLRKTQVIQFLIINRIEKM